MFRTLGWILLALLIGGAVVLAARNLRRSRRGVWLEGLGISAASGLLLFGSVKSAASPFTGGLIVEVAFNTRLMVSVFVSCVIGLVAISVLTASGYRADPWRARDNRIGRGAAWSVSGALLALSVSIVGDAAIVSLLPYVFAMIAAVAGFFLSRRQWVSRPDEVRSHAAGLPFLRDQTLADDTRAELLRRTVRDAVTARDERARDWLPEVLAQPMSPTMEAALFAAIAEAPADFSEPLLAGLLTHESPTVQAKAAHLLAWFGTPKAIEKLRAVTGPGADAADAAAARIKNRAGVADEGRLSLATSDRDGSLSMSEAGGLAVAPPRNGARLVE